jgi:hypothetical protein
VDVQNPDKVLTVSSEGVSETIIQAAIEKAGFNAKKIN